MLIVLLTLPTFAGSFLTNQDCIDVYRSAYLDLSQITKEFNNENLNRLEYATIVSGLSTEVVLHRGACLMMESPSAKECVASYKEIYKGLRNNVKLGAILAGNQKKVAHTESMQTIVDTELVEKEETGVISKVAKFLKITKGTIVEEVKIARNITMIEFLDNKCDQ